VRKVSCGDNHSCALDSVGRVWLWGTYKDSNGHIGIARKRKQGPVLEKSAEPAIVLEGCTQIASGANHTLALVPSASGAAKVFSWGSNGTGQLGLLSGEGCGIEERLVQLTLGAPRPNVRERAGGGTEVDSLRLIRIREASGKEQGATTMSLTQVEQALAAGAAALVLEVPEREVPKPEKQSLLLPQEVSLGEIDGSVSGVFASAECSFVTVAGGPSYGCGLNGDGQVGLGFASMAVRTLRPLPASVAGASWLGGGLHASTALVDAKVRLGPWTECCTRHGAANLDGPSQDPDVAVRKCSHSRML